MKRITTLCMFALLCVALPQNALAENKRPNILLICVDDLRPELPSFGKDYIKAPTIEKLAATGRLFTRHYVHAPTCGASRFALLTGIYNNKVKGAMNNRAIDTYYSRKGAKPSVAHWFRKHGYATMAVGKVSHYPGGLGGRNWDNPKQLEMPGAWTYQPKMGGPWKSARGLMHGYANGKPRIKGKSPQLEAVADAPYPDDFIVETFAETFPKLTGGDQPWFCAVGLLRPHLPFACPKKYLDLYTDVELPPIPANAKPKNGYWHKSREFFDQYSKPADPREDADYADQVRKHYAACVSYADAKIAEILDTLEKSGQADNTVVVLWGDHGWHLGEQKIWGKHSPYAVALHSPLIIRTPGMEKLGASEAIVETADIYPTLCELAGLPKPGHLDGSSLVPQLKDPASPTDQEALSWWDGLRSVITPAEHKIYKGKQLIYHYDLIKDPHETNNLVK